ncbi:ribonuclease P [Choanephora cucurbitarum]|nr:ribonuclease P [Choanephora cucurbitarum]
MHSLNTHLNTDDVVVLYPDGKLCLSLVKQTFETFGIEAMKQTKADQKHDKHIVMIDFKKGHFKPDSKEFNRLKWCLENTLTSSFAMACCAIDSLTGAIVDIEWPTSLVERKERIEIKAEFDTITDAHIPSFEHLAHDLSARSEGWDGHAMEALEWLGLAHIKASRIKKTEKIPDPFVSVYQPPTPFIQENQMGTFVKFSGLLPAPLMHNIMTIVRKLMTSGVTTHWASITCWGYQDTPLVWQQQTAHYHYYNGENDYTCLFLPNNTCYLYQLLGH